MEPRDPRILAALRALALDDRALTEACEMSFLIGSGPGGQHRNKTESAVRLHHLETGIVVTATERRSQSQNRHAAIERLRSKLAALCVVQKPRKATRPTFGSRRRRVDQKKRVGAKKAMRRSREDE